MKVVRCKDGHFYDADKYSECPLCKKISGNGDQNPQVPKEKTIVIGKEPSSQIHPNEVDFSKLDECKNVTTITSTIDNREPSTMKANENLQKENTSPVRPGDNETQTVEGFSNQSRHLGNDDLEQNNTDRNLNKKPERPDDNGETQTGFDFSNQSRHLSNYGLEQNNTDRDFDKKLTRPDDNGETQVNFGNIKKLPEVQITPSQGHVSSRKNNGPVVGWVVAIKGPHIGQSFELYAKKNFIGRNNEMAVNLFNDKTVSRTSPLSIVFNRHNSKFMAMTGNSDQTAYINGDLVLQPIQLNENDEISIGSTILVFIPLLKDGKRIEEFYRVE